MTMELEQTLQKRLDESNNKKEAQFVSDRLHCRSLSLSLSLSVVVVPDHFVTFDRKSNATSLAVMS